MDQACNIIDDSNDANKNDSEITGVEITGEMKPTTIPMESEEGNSHIQESENIYKPIVYLHKSKMYLHKTQTPNGTKMKMGRQRTTWTTMREMAYKIA